MQRQERDEIAKLFGGVEAHEAWARREVRRRFMAAGCVALPALALFWVGWDYVLPAIWHRSPLLCIAVVVLAQAVLVRLFRRFVSGHLSVEALEGLHAAIWRGTHDLISVLDQGRPFALYLRSFAVESTRVDEPPWRSIHILGRHSYPRHGESRIIPPIAAKIPVFAPMNVNDANPDPLFRCVLLDPNGWYPAVEYLCQRAVLIIIWIAELREGVLRECAYLAASGLADRVLVIRSHPRLDAQHGSVAELCRTARWSGIDGNSPEGGLELPTSLMAYLGQFGPNPTG